MECRLCGIYTKLEDLVVSLLDVGDSAVTFKEFAEHYLQRKLSNSASLPSLCCGTCQHQLVKFYRFSYNVDQHQIKLEKSLEQLPVQCSADDHPEQRELQKSQVHKEPKAELVEQPLQISRSVNVEVHNESLLQEVTTEEQRKPSRKRVHFDDTSSGPDKKRRKSLFHDEPSGSEKKAKARRNSFLDTPTNVMKTRRKSVILDKLSVFADKEDVSRFWFNRTERKIQFAFSEAEQREDTDSVQRPRRYKLFQHSNSEVKAAARRWVVKSFYEI